MFSSIHPSLFITAAPYWRINCLCIHNSHSAIQHNTDYRHHRDNRSAHYVMEYHNTVSISSINIIICQSSSPSPPSSLSFTRSTSTDGWNYPFSLCASLYRTVDLLLLCTHLQHNHALKDYNHPNSLEVISNNIISKQERAANSRDRYRHWYYTSNDEITIFSYHHSISNSVILSYVSWFHR